MLHESRAYDNPIGNFSHFFSLRACFHTKADADGQS